MKVLEMIFKTCFMHLKLKFGHFEVNSNVRQSAFFRNGGSIIHLQGEGKNGRLMQFFYLSIVLALQSNSVITNSLGPPLPEYTVFAITVKRYNRRVKIKQILTT
jgi:hypothetical protein